MSRNIAPATISSPDDLAEYWIANAEPLDPNSASDYTKRHIHSEIYKRHANINAVVHSHSDAVIPYTIMSVALRACYHMAGFLGAEGVLVYNITEYLEQGDLRDMLVRNEHLGSALARFFDDGNSVTLMCGHGFTTVGDSIQQAVLQAVYTQKNAAIQTAALTIGAPSASMAPRAALSSIQYLTKEEAQATADMTKWSSGRPWKLWTREVEASGLYVNSA
ncbi:class II aldolase and Adducin domain-containing protein [Lasiosphaeria ovina]|uniref:Class II aldolase and Adducin domain-containing protein n=1 Tax=Lasiosphaeria ovina TaxID=92902 RepID=A0AAE0JRG8_9PEZI|nr:class II aldolase and Adducin domain-containing protein [Lasiosphaeria ovina]KAK3361172.1 class II aldolase and Adducin domain-containing protein [Lasiosphaeria ovina]